MKDICRYTIHYCSTTGCLCRKHLPLTLQWQQQQLSLSKVAKCRISSRPATEGTASSQQSHIVLKVSQEAEQETSN